MTRIPLPNRRPSATIVTEYAGREITVTIGYDLSGNIRELFADGHKDGSDMQAIMADACVVASIALQRGATVQELHKSLGLTPEFDGTTRSASVIGAIVGAVIATP